LGYESKDLIGEPVMKLYADNEFGIKKAKAIFANFIKGISTTNEKLQMVKKDGGVTWVSITVEPVIDENDKIVQSRSMVVDINAQVESQRQLESGRLQMLQAQNIAKLGSWEWDIISGKVILSENLYEIYGVDKSSFNGSIEEFIAHVHENDREAVSNAITDCKDTLIPMDFHHRTIPINNKIFTVHCNGVIISDESGTPISMVGTAQNVTERVEAVNALKKSEISLANAQEISRTGNWEENYETGELFWSDECKRILGFDPADELIQGDFWKVVHPDDRDALRTLWDDLEQNPQNYENTFRIILKDDSIRHIRERTQFQKKDNGQLKVVMGTIQDITQEMEAEREIKDSREQLRELSGHLRSIQEEERANIAREIHDELGQGLTGIKMDLSWLRNKLTKEDVAVNERIDSLNYLIDDTIQSVRRISSELHPAVLDDLGLKAAIEWQASEFGKRSGILCAIKINEMEFDKKHSKAIFRIIQESLTNIMRHAQANKVSIIIDDNGEGSIVKIIDNGIGFESENEKINKSFGLMSMKERAYELGGTLNIIAGQGKGTTIELNIPKEMEQT
jgi:PAS domain S-box-containing protein